MFNSRRIAADGPAWHLHQAPGADIMAYGRVLQETPTKARVFQRLAVALGKNQWSTAIHWRALVLGCDWLVAFLRP